MPTVYEVISRVDSVRPSAIPMEAKARWVMEAEGQLLADTVGEDGETLPPCVQFPDSFHTQLTVQPPYDGIYDLYLSAMIEFHSGEYDAYNNAALLYGQARKEYLARYRRENVPERRDIKNLF